MQPIALKSANKWLQSNVQTRNGQQRMYEENLPTNQHQLFIGYSFICCYQQMCSLNHGRIVSSVMTQKGKQGRWEEECMTNTDCTQSKNCTWVWAHIGHIMKPSTLSLSRSFKSALTGWRLSEHGQRLAPHCLHGERVLARRWHSLVFYTPIHRKLLVQSERYLHRAQMLFHIQKSKSLFETSPISSLKNRLMKTCMQWIRLVPLLTSAFPWFPFLKHEENVKRIKQVFLQTTFETVSTANLCNHAVIYSIFKSWPPWIPSWVGH